MRIYNWEQSIKKVFENRAERDVIVYGTDVFSKEIVKTIIHLGIQIAYIIGEGDEFEGISVRPIEEILSIDNKKYFVMVAVLQGHKNIYNSLIAYGLQYQKDFYIMGIGGYTELLNAIDSLLTLNRLGDTLPGFKIFSDDEKAYKIVVLGNSTSDATTANIKSWSEYLFEKFKGNNYNVQIYCGAVTGYSSTQEFLKLSRDVINLSPDLVISLSGYNDVKGISTEDGFPFLHKYQKKFYDFLKEHPRLAPDSMYVRNVSNITHGIMTMDKDYQIWINNMRKMYAICTEFKINFRAYLQPMVEYHGPIKSKVQEEIIHEYYRLTNTEATIDMIQEFCESAKKVIDNYPYIVDLTELFRNDCDIFYDTCHCNEKGNEKIANAIYENIKNLIPEKHF